MSRPRRDPRAERAAWLRPGPRRPRLELTRAGLGSVPLTEPRRADAASPRPEKVRIADPGFWLLVVPDLPTGGLTAADRGLIGAARQLAGGGGGVAVIGGYDTDSAGAAGADLILRVDGDRGALELTESLAALVLQAIERLRPRHVLCGDDPLGAGDIARRVAAKLGQRACTGVVELRADQAARRAEGGRMEHRLDPPLLLTLRPEAGVAHAGPPHETRSELMPGAPAGSGERPRLLPIDPDTVPLAEAQFIVAAGNGVTDFAAFNELATALGAVKGGSRVVCDAGLLPRDRQIGASGTVVRARCYLALGIAGAPQHLQGITEVEHVLAVNTDLHAEMVKRSGLAIIADAQTVMPALARRLRERRAC